MPEFLRTARRFRTAVQCGEEEPLEVETLLPRLYEAVCLALPDLSVSALRAKLRRHQAFLPPNLLTCQDRRLRGGILAWRGKALLFADANDSLEERRFTFAHEAAHFLQDHLYPRLDLLERFGPSILPVLNGERPPTREERIDALLARENLAQQMHLLARDEEGSEEIWAREADANAFACEILAPRAALMHHFPPLTAGEDSVDHVQSLLCREFQLPPLPALNYARTFIAEQSEPVTLLHRLGLA